MSSTIREQILAAIVGQLAGTAQVGTRIFRERINPIGKEECPCLIIEPVSDAAVQSTTSRTEWTLNMKVIINTRGDEPSHLADPIIADVHSKMFADRSIGGLAIDIQDRDVQFLRYEGDQVAGLIEMSFDILYITNVADVTSTT